MKLRIRYGNVTVRADVQDSSTLHQVALALVQVSWPELELSKHYCVTPRALRLKAFKCRPARGCHSTNEMTSAASCAQGGGATSAPATPSTS